MRFGVQWEVSKPSPKEAEALSSSLQISSALAQILINRGIKTEADARLFLNCQLRDLRDPFLLPGMQKAVERTLEAIQKNEQVVLYGDYDVDGVTSVAMLQRVLNALGLKNVQSFLPDRFDEGYGLTLAGIERALFQGKPSLMIVLDCGTNSGAEVAELRKRKIDVIILDHHEPSSVADPLALINYKLNGGDSDGTEYCTAGLVFKFSHALLKFARQKQLGSAQELDLKTYLDLVALATVADIAPLKGENRILTRHGLKQMMHSDCIGLRALMQIASIKNEPSGYDCGFKLGPRLNAAGRLESAMDSLNLLTSSDESEALKIAQKLDATNKDRQAEELRVFVEAREDAQAQFEDKDSRVIVVARTGWHEGVVGIVASRLVKEFHLPTFVIALNEEGMGKGSGRSIEGFNLAVAVDKTRHLLTKGGGHAMAAGVGLEEKKVVSWRQALQVHAREDQGLMERLKRVVRADVEVSFSQLTFSLVEELQKLEPCGMGNPRPILLGKNIEVASEPRTVGAEGKHLKLWLRQEGVSIDAIAFGKGELSKNVQKGTRLDLMFELEINEYQGNKKLQINVREIAVSRGI